MGSITLTIVGDGTIGTKTKTYTISDADVTRLVNVWKTKATSAAVPNPTVTQACVALADNAVATMKLDTLAIEQAAAAAAITAISVT